MKQVIDGEYLAGSNSVEKIQNILDLVIVNDHDIVDRDAHSGRTDAEFEHGSLPAVDFHNIADAKTAVKHNGKAGKDIRNQILCTERKGKRDRGKSCQNRTGREAEILQAEIDDTEYGYILDAAVEQAADRLAVSRKQDPCQFQNKAADQVDQIGDGNDHQAAAE